MCVLNLPSSIFIWGAASQGETSFCIIISLLKLKLDFYGEKPKFRFDQRYKA